MGAGLVGLVATEDEDEVAILGTHLLLDLLENLWTIEFVDARLHCAIGIVLDIHKSLCANLRTLADTVYTQEGSFVQGRTFSLPRA